MIDYTFLLIGIIYTTILPGFVVVETFFSKLEAWKKVPLYLTLSVIISTYTSYFVSLTLGFNRPTLLVCFLVFCLFLLLLIFKKRTSSFFDISKNKVLILFGMLVYFIYFISLYPAIFSLYDGSFVMSGPNWQDTAMHLSIIQSLVQGNFPPQAPYFSGQPLTYYYFADLHAAIINTFFGHFFPWVLTLVNPFFAMTFFFSVFALSFEISKKRSLSVIAGLTAVFYGNLEFVNLIKNLILEHANYLYVISGNPFNYDQNYFLMTPMSDYFLQNRPMMVGLPIFALTILIGIGLFKNKKIDINETVLMGILIASLIKFQLFGFIVSWIFVMILSATNFIMKKVDFVEILKTIFILAIPSVALSLMFIFTKVGGRLVTQVGTDSLIWFPWQSHNLKWFLFFIFGDLNIGFVIFIIGFLIRKIWKDINVFTIYVTGAVIFLATFIVRFTIYEYDMLKFFYYLIPIICVFLAYFYSKSKHYKLSIFLFFCILILSSITSFNLLIHSYLNKTKGYSVADFKAGGWIADNTLQRSVFVTMPTVHSAPSDIGGRLRVISYINWPYSHGFNVGDDNVFARVRDVTYVYKTGDVNLVKVKYNAKYVFYGDEELSQFPNAGYLFDKNINLSTIYNSNGIKIYEIH